MIFFLILQKMNKIILKILVFVSFITFSWLAAAIIFNKICSIEEIFLMCISIIICMIAVVFLILVIKKEKRKIILLIKEKLKEHGFHDGRLIAFSKSGYRKNNPDSIFIPNAKILTIKGEIFQGDLDLKIDRNALKRISSKFNITFYIFNEHDFVPKLKELLLSVYCVHQIDPNV